jgi:lipoate-protein ligase A
MIIAAFASSSWNKCFQLERNEFNDLILSANRHKVSGSAYRVLQKKAYHHGTFLVSSDISLLSKLLVPDLEQSLIHSSHSLPSRRSPVFNICDIAPSFGTEDFFTLLSHQFQAKFMTTDVKINLPYIFNYVILNCLGFLHF